MIIIGERINSSRPSVKEAILKKDEDFILNEARVQFEAGVTFLDVNCATTLEKEEESIKWTIKLIQANIDIPICIDSPSPKAIEAALSVCKGKALINSITLEESRLVPVLELAKNYEASIIALVMDTKGIPPDPAQRLDIAKKICDTAHKRYTIPKDRLYFDPIVQPISVGTINGKVCLDTLKLLKQNGFRTVMGLSNISYGLPKRRLINSTFFSMCLCIGLDAVIMDPLDKRMNSTLKASNALIGQDDYCCSYLEAYRANLLE